MARGVASFLNPFSGHPSSPDDVYHTPGATTPVIQQQASPVPSGLDEAIADFESDRVNEWLGQESQRSQKTESSRRSLREHLDETHQQQSVLLPLAGGVGLSPASSRSSPVPPTEYYIGSSPSLARGFAQSVHSSPPVAQSVHSSPPAQSVHSSPAAQSVHSSPARIRDQIRSELLRRQLGY